MKRLLRKKRFAIHTSHVCPDQGEKSAFYFKGELMVLSTRNHGEEFTHTYNNDGARSNATLKDSCCGPCVGVPFCPWGTSVPFWPKF